MSIDGIKNTEVLAIHVVDYLISTSIRYTDLIKLQDIDFRRSVSP